MFRVGIVGAGVAGAAASYRLDRAAPGVAVTVLEASERVAGRSATRRRGEVTYDYGANYLKSDDGSAVELVTETLDDEGLVDVAEPVWTFDADGVVAEGRDADDPKWTYRAGIARLAERLFDRAGATIHRNTRVEGTRRADDGWRLVDADGAARGPFDAVVVTPPAPRTAELLGGGRETGDTEQGSEGGDGGVTDAVAAAAAAVPYRAVWTAVLHYPFELDRPYYALVNTDKDHEVGWIAREECKPGHLPDGESLLIVQANHGWSIAHAGDPPEENVAELAAATADVVGDERLTDPDWTDHRGWRHALPEAGADRDPLRRAEADGLYCAGDWVAGEARLHAALRSGLEVGDRIAGAR